MFERHHLVPILHFLVSDLHFLVGLSPFIAVLGIVMDEAEVLEVLIVLHVLLDWIQLVRVEEAREDLFLRSIGIYDVWHWSALVFCVGVCFLLLFFIITQGS